MIEIKAPDIRIAKIRIKGTTPFLSHNFSEASKQKILDIQTKKNVGPRPIRNPEQEYEDSLYKTSDGGCGIKAVAFKLAAVRAAKAVAGLAMTDARQMFYFVADDGELVRIEGEHHMRTDICVVGKKQTDLRFRAEFPEWAVTLNIKFNAAMISLEQIVNLIHLAGFSVGVGDWRMELGGTHGAFEIDEKGVAA